MRGINKTLLLGLASVMMLSASDNCIDANGEPKAECTGSEPSYGPGDTVSYSDMPVIPNAPLVAKKSRIITLEAVGMGVAPEKTISPAQSLAMAKRAAIIDGYRQLGEKMHGVTINGQETVKDMILQNSTIKTRLLSLVKNANVLETKFESGLCQVKMELKVDGYRWYHLLAGKNF